LPTACARIIQLPQLRSARHVRARGREPLPARLPRLQVGRGDEVVDHARFNAIVAKLSTAATPDAERQALARELGNLQREKVYHPENWEALGEVHCPEKGKQCEAASDARLTELGLTRDDIAHHKPPVVTKPSQGRFHKVGLADGTTVKDHN